MNKLKLFSRFAVAWVFLLLAFANNAAAQSCNIAAKTDGCVGVAETFTVSGTAISNGYDSLRWSSSTGTSSTNPATFLWNSPTGGPSVVSVTIYKGGVAVCVTTFNITIHANPLADFALLSPTPQCFNGNRFKFQDNSTTPGGNPIVWREFTFGDGGKQVDSTPNPIPGTIGGSSGYHYTPANPGVQNNFDPTMKIRDSKGCIAFIQKPSFLSVKADLGADFKTPNPKNCDSTPVTFTNTSIINQADAKNFWWDFGDGAVDATNTNWTGFKHVYYKDGCFKAKLIVESNDGCFDTAFLPAACNVHPILDVSVKNGDVQCFGTQDFVFTHPVIQGATFLWTFDDPPTGPQNFDNKQWTTSHDFSSAGPYDVTFRLNTQNCSFDTVYRVHVKGPAAGIETKPAPLIAPSQRYQCKIHDTVFFPNISSYYLNDDSAYNDFYYTVKGAIFQFIDANKLHVDFDTIFTNTGTAQNITTKTGRKVTVNAAGDSITINGQLVWLQGRYLVKGTRQSDKDPFWNNGKHVDRVWDFADNVAPKCTTDSRPIYPKAAKYGNLHFPSAPAPAWTYDANGHWYNCNFNRDSLPKHWYTPGEERCYTVRLILKDTSKADPNIQSLTASGNDPAGCESQATVNLALQGPDASGLKFNKFPCYGSPNTYGIEFDFSKTGPSCDRQMFWIHLDSTADRVDNTPNVFDKWIPQSGTVVDRKFTPWPLATLNLPPNVGKIFWQYQPSGSYPSKIADKAGWVTVGFRVQNGVDPVTGQPCIDEKWYHNEYRYIQSNPGFQYYNVNKPDSSYTFERVCAPNDLLIKRDSTFLPATNTFTYASDSIGAEIWTWGDGESETDSFFRYQCKGNTCYSYRITYKILPDGTFSKTDSVVTRIYDANTGKSTFIDARDSVPEIYRQHRYNTPGYYQVRHTIVPCQLQPGTDSAGNLIFLKSCCDAPPFDQVRVAINGIFAELNATDSIVCRNTPIQFFDSGRYFLEFPIPFPPYIIDAYDYWNDPLHDATGAPRNRPRPFPADYEKLRWDFGDGKGWNASVPNNPTRSYPTPGTYDVKLEYTDSLGCKQVLTKKINITGVSANFTFNRKMTQCFPTVDFIDTSLMIDPCRLVKNSKCDDIISWRWDFGDNKPNNQSQSVLQHPSKVYTSFGDFDVLLIVKTKLGCEDSIKRTISLEGPRPRFEFAADSVGCVPFTVELRNISINPTKGASWTWLFGDKSSLTTSSGGGVSHTYDSAGTFEIFLLQTDSVPIGAGQKCQAIFPDTNNTFGQYRKYIVRVLPSRKTAFTISDSVICVGDSVTFISNSDSIYSTYKWITGTGDTIVKAKTAGGDTTGKKYKAPGVFYVQLRPTYTPPPGEPTCPTSAVHPVYVRDVKAIIKCDTTQKPTIYFKNNSTNAQKWWWDFGAGQGFEDGLAMATNPHALHNYGENKGFYTVLLAVESPEGCKDTDYCQFIYDYQIKFNPPNVFTPGDGNTVNDFFDVEVLNEEMYNLAIYNRWGEKVYEADNKDAKWNGNHKGDGAPCPAGVYFVVIKYRLRGDKDKIYHGTLNLIR